MEKNKKKKIANYIVLIVLVISVISYNIIRNLKKVTKKSNKITTDIKKVNNTKKQKEIEEVKVEVYKNKIENRYIKKEVIRDIFQSIKKENVEITEQKKTTRKIEIPFKIKGIFELGNEKTIILNTGEIINENETIKGFKVLKIEEGNVILLDKLGKVYKINIWGK